MPNVTLSGYLVTPVTVTFSGTQTLNSLIDNEWTDFSDEIDNTTNKYRLADLELVLGSAAYTGSDSGMEFFLLACQDGTNYPGWTGNVTTDESENYNHFVGFQATTGATAAQRMVLRDVELPNGKFRFAIRNRSNATTPASGNTLTYRPHSVAI